MKHAEVQDTNTGEQQFMVTQRTRYVLFICGLSGSYRTGLAPTGHLRI